MKAAKAMPKSNENEKEQRQNAINRVRMIRDSKKVLTKKYTDGIEKFDVRVLSSSLKRKTSLMLRLKRRLTS